MQQTQTVVDFFAGVEIQTDSLRSFVISKLKVFYLKF